jgi:hypothetical protein
MARFFWFVVGSLAVWRMTHLLVEEDGPGDVVVFLRRSAGEGFWGRLLDCFYCLSLWTAAPVAWFLATSWYEWLLLWPGLSGSAVLLDRMAGGPTVELPADGEWAGSHRPPPYVEEPLPTGPRRMPRAPENGNRGA